MRRNDVCFLPRDTTESVLLYKCIWLYVGIHGQFLTSPCRLTLHEKLLFSLVAVTWRGSETSTFIAVYWDRCCRRGGEGEGRGGEGRGGEGRGGEGRGGEVRRNYEEKKRRSRVKALQIFSIQHTCVCDSNSPELLQSVKAGWETAVWFCCALARCCERCLHSDSSSTEWAFWQSSLPLQLVGLVKENIPIKAHLPIDHTPHVVTL